MKSYKNSFVLLVSLLSALNVAAQNLSRDEIKAGLGLLYKNANCTEKEFCLATPGNEKILIENALQFKAKLDSVIGDATLKNLKWTKVSSSMRQFEFDSPIQRQGNHAANKVHGFVYLPVGYTSCSAPYPATLLMHKLSDDIDSEKQIASISTKMNKGVVMLIYLPHFGLRSQSKTEKFITKDAQQFELNMLQALADIHLSHKVLQSLENVQKNNIGLMGLSLGAMISLISAGLDPIFDRYATNVGGGDLANIVTYRKTGDVDSQTGQVLKEIDWSVDQARFNLSQFDAITWSLNVKNKTVTMINALRDELISRPLSLDPLIEGYKLSGTSVNLIVHEGTHVFRAKEIGIWNSLTQVMLPMLSFIGDKAPTAFDCKDSQSPN